MTESSKPSTGFSPVAGSGSAADLRLYPSSSVETADNIQFVSSADRRGDQGTVSGEESGSVIEFGTLSDEDGESIPMGDSSMNSDGGGLTPSELSAGEKTTVEFSTDFSGEPETVPFMSVETAERDVSEADVQDNEIRDDETRKEEDTLRETVSIDRNHVEYSDASSAESVGGGDGPNGGGFAETIAEETAGEDEVPDGDETAGEDEIIDEAGADLTYDRMIQERLLRGGGAEETDANSPGEEGNEDWESSDGEMIYPMTSALNPDRKDRYLEELRLLELEVSQEADLIRKIRGMHSGLESFRMDDAEAASHPRGCFDAARTTTAISETEAPHGANDYSDSASRPTLDTGPSHGKSAQEAKKAPVIKKNRPFLHIFEKIYPEDGLTNR